MIPRLVCLVGPTGAGKTAAALHLATALHGAVVNADSRQVYRDFPVITAQPSAEERGVCPHSLYGVLDTETGASAGWWAEAATREMEREHAEGRLPLLVGGTGLYLRGLLDGMVEIPPVPDEVSRELEAVLNEQGGQALHARLTAVDPVYAARIHANDRQRLVRALGVHAATGRTFSWWHAQTPAPPPCDVLRLGLFLPLSELEPRLAVRVDAMLAAGALDEARAAMARCPDRDAPGWSGIGCAELHAHLRGALSLDEARSLWIRNTRAYAKRQLTWFRADKRIVWFRPGEEDALLAAGRDWFFGGKLRRSGMAGCVESENRDNDAGSDSAALS